MDDRLISAVAFSLPLIGALVCGCIAALDALKEKHPARLAISRQALWTYGFFAIFWSLLVTRMVFPEFHALTMPLLVTSIMTAYVMTFKMILSATDQGQARRFSREHFVLPALVLVVMGTLWVALPLSRLGAVSGISPIQSQAGYILRCSILGLCFAYSIAYPVAVLVRIVQFRRKQRNGGPHDKVLARLFWAVIVEMVVMPVPVFGMLLGLEFFERWGWWWILAVLPSRIIYVLGCFDLLSDNYMVIDEARLEQPPSASPQRLGRERVDRYIETRRPWLNPDFRIGDMAQDLFSNRAYVSAFINSEYGVNFSRFVNGFRLEEVEKLKQEAKRKKQHVPMLQLVLNAGFSNYRSYLRAKHAQKTPPANHFSTPGGVVFDR
jgi:AraC-like DNA-binding protein